jgi:hypothetical protein
MAKTPLIYALCDPRTEAVRYIGQSENGLVRARKHARQARCGERGHKANWIRQLQTLGLDYIIVIVEQTTIDRLDDRERHWIKYYRAQGHLLNVLDGGSNLRELPPGYISEKARARQAALPPEVRRARAENGLRVAHAANAALSQEERTRRAKYAGYIASTKRSPKELEEQGRRWGTTSWSTLTPDERSERGRKASLSRTPEERRTYTKTWWASLTPQQREDHLEKNKKKRLQAATAGTVFGKPSPFEKHTAAQAIALRSNGASIRSIAKTFGVSCTAVRNLLKRVSNG